MGHNMCTRHIKITYANGIPCVQIKISQNLELQKIRLHWATIFVPKHKGYTWGWYSMGRAKIIQSLDSRKIRLRWASTLARKT